MNTDGSKDENEQYLSWGLQMETNRTANHIQMMSDKNIQNFANYKYTYVVHLNEMPSICNMKEEETMKNVLFECPRYKEIRTRPIP